MQTLVKAETWESVRYIICWFNIPLESGQTLIKIPLADTPFFQVLLFSVASFPFSFEIPISMQEYIYC